MKTQREVVAGRAVRALSWCRAFVWSVCFLVFVPHVFAAQPGEEPSATGEGESPKDPIPAAAPPRSKAPANTRTASQKARPPSRPRPRTEKAEPREREEAVPEQKDPFKRPPGPAGSMERLWALDVGFGLSAPFKADKGQPAAGVHVRLGAGRRLVLKGNFSLWVGLGFSFHSLTTDDSVVLNPSDPLESQVKCEDDKGSTIWTIKAKMWADWAWWRLRLRLGAFGGAAFGDYTQLNRNFDTSGQQLPECTNEGMDAWMAAAGAWVRLGWAFSRKAEAGLFLGSMFVFGADDFKFRDAQDRGQRVQVFTHLMDAGAYFTHRF